MLVVEKWRVGTRAKASCTRSYIAAAKTIENLRDERGDFASERDFNDYWRGQEVKESKRMAWQKRHGY